MKNILVTGYNGFIGKNLIERLNRLENVNILKFGRKDDLNTLEEFLKKADFIYHLAGSNRPKQISEFNKVNIGLTQNIINILERHNRIVPILMTSSIQAELDNPYGISKKNAENILVKYNMNYNADIYICRLPNVFGKWSKPNYNSVVATFCYNISRDLDITISDVNKELELVYIDDVIDSFVTHLNKTSESNKKYYLVKTTYKVTLGELADSIYKIKNNRNTLIIPNLKDSFMKALHATYLSFLEKDNFSYELKQYVDDRGSFVEIIKSKEFGQISISTTKGKIARGNHYHNTKNEKFCVVKGKAVIRFKNIYSDEVIEYYVSDERLEVVDIPPGYTHNIENLSDDEMILFIWANEIFDKEKTDTYYCKL